MYKLVLMILLYATTAASCSGINKLMVGYKDNISYDTVKINQKFVRENTISTYFFKSDSIRVLATILSRFSNKAYAGDGGITLPLPVVYNNESEAFVNFRAGFPGCDYGFINQLKDLNQYPLFLKAPMEIGVFYNYVLGEPPKKDLKKYDVFIFWSQKFYRAYSRNVVPWIAYAKSNPEINIYPVNVDLLLFKSSSKTTFKSNKDR